MARKEIFIDVFETDTFNEWRLKTNSIKINLQDIYDELDALDSKFVSLTGDQTINGVKSFIQKSRWTKEYTQNEITPMLELRVTNSTNPHGQNIGHKGVGPSIDFYNPDTTTTGNTWLTSRIASITESAADILPDASLVFFTGKNTEDIVEKMRITSNGRVGIGTTNPRGQLSVKTPNNNSIISIQSKVSNYAAVTFGDDSSHESGAIQYHNTGNSMRFFTGEKSSGNSAERLRITSAGRVGIGITAPAVALDIDGDIQTTGNITAGLRRGSIALTRNDAYGNASVAFNHAYGKPGKSGSSARIETQVDSTTAGMVFELGDNTIADAPTDLDQIMYLTTSKIHLYEDTQISGNLNTLGKIGVGGVDKPDYAVCIGGTSKEAGHVAFAPNDAVISFRPLQNTTHGWMFNAFNSAGGGMGVGSRKFNTTTGNYDDTYVLTFNSNNSITTNKINIGSNSGAGTSPNTKLFVKGGSESGVSAQFRGAIQVNQFDAASRAHGFLSTNQGSAMVGGNLRLTDDSTNSNVGKTATVYIVADNEYVLYHNSNVIGTGNDWRQTGIHTFEITGNDRLGITAQNLGGPFGLAFVVVVNNEIVLTSNKRDTVAVKDLPGTFSPRWNVDFNLFNVEGNVPIDGSFSGVKSTLLATLQQPSIDLDGKDVENIWANGGIEINRNFFFQTRLQEVSQSYVKGTNQRGSSAIEFIEGANATGQITFLRATDTNDNTYFVNESARFDEQGRFGIGTTKPQQALDIVGNIRSSGPYIYLQNDGYPQLVLSNADGATKRFGVWRNKHSDQMLLGPQSANGNGRASIIINRNGTIGIPEGGKVNVVDESDPVAIVNKQYVDNQIATGGLTAIGKSDVFQATGNLGGFEKGTLSRFKSMLGNPIPTDGPGNHSHGKNFAGMLAATHATDGGGLFLDVTDNNNDEHALSIYNTSTSIDKEVFHIRSKSGDTYTAGNIYARGGIASETKMVIGDADNHWIVEKSNKNLVISNRDGSPSTALSIAPNGQVSIEHEPIAPKHAATKQYVDDIITGGVLTVLPRFSTASGNVVNSSYEKNTEFSFDIAELTGLGSENVARVYAVDATVHTFGGGRGGVNFSKNFIETSFKYPDGSFRIIQSSHGVNNDDDCGSSASIQLPVSGTKVVFKANHPGRATPDSGIKGVCKVVINGFWYYDEASLATSDTTGSFLPGVDKLDMDVLILDHIPHASDLNVISDHFKEGVRHDILVDVYQPRPTQASEWIDFNNTIDTNEYGVVAVVPFTHPYDSTTGPDDIPLGTYNTIKNYITRGGTLFIFSDHERIYRKNPGIEQIIYELGGIKAGATNALNDMNMPDWIVAGDMTGRAVRFDTHPQGQAIGAVRESTYTKRVRNGGGTQDDPIVEVRRFSLTTQANASINNNFSNGIPLASRNVRRDLSIVHMWDGGLGHLNSDVKGKIVWFGDINLGGGFGEGIIHPLLTYIDATN
jgi:hypothetical protein